MDKLSTVVVVGAGASKELGLPLGSELRTEIASLLGAGSSRSDELTYQAIHHAEVTEHGAHSWSDYARVGRRIARAMPQAISIDNFVYDQRDDSRIAMYSKIAITRCILRAEAGSRICRALSLRRSPSNHVQKGDRFFRFEETEDTWLNQFFRSLVQGCTRNDLPARFENVAFVIFNYDRCIETFATVWVSDYYNLSRRQAAEIVGRITFLHPYGHVGDVSWGDQDLLPRSFGSEPSAEMLYKLSKGIRTFTEGVEEGSSEVEQIRERLDAAKQVIFLGFGYIELNLKLLERPGRFYRPDRIIGTAQGLSEFDSSEVRNRLCQMFRLGEGGGMLFLNADSCLNTVRDFSRALQPRLE